MDLLPAEASVFVAFEDDLGEVGREVVDVGVGGGAHEARGRVGDDCLHPLGGQWGGGGTDVRVLPDTQAEEEVRPDILDQRDVRRFIHPCRRMLWATQTVRLFAGEGVSDRPVGPRQLLLRRLPFGTLPRGGRGEHSVDYAANAGVVPAIAAIGDKDTFFQSHVHMGQVFAKEGIPFVNLISPGTGHVIDPKTHAEQMRRIGEYVAAASIGH